MNRDHFVLIQAFEPKGISTCACRSCMCCGSLITSSGGGGEYICKECVDRMRDGVMMDALRLLHRQEGL